MRDLNGKRPGFREKERERDRERKRERERERERESMCGGRAGEGRERDGERR